MLKMLNKKFKVACLALALSIGVAPAIGTVQTVHASTTTYSSIAVANDYVTTLNNTALKQSAGNSAKTLFNLPKGSLVKIVSDRDGTVAFVDGLIWQMVVYGNLTGWVPIKDLNI